MTNLQPNVCNRDNYISLWYSKEILPIIESTQQLFTHVVNFCIVPQVNKVIEIVRALFCKAREWLVTPTEYLQDNRVWHVIKKNTLLYREPQLVTSTIGSLSKGSFVEIIGHKNSYLKVKIQSNIGFIQTSATSILAHVTPQKSSLNAPSKAYIIFLKGTCSSGKSSLASYYSKVESWVTIDDDIICMKEYVDAWRLSHPKEMEVISEAIDEKNIYMAIKRNLFCFKTNSSQTIIDNTKIAIETIQKSYEGSFETWRVAPHKKIRSSIQERINTAISDGKNVLLDSWFYTAKQIEELFSNTQVIKMMLFSPLHTCLKRLQRRNLTSDTERDFQEKRFKAHVLESFFNLYKLSINKEGSISWIDKTTINSLFNTILPTLPTGYRRKHSPIEKELSQEDFSALIDSFLEPFKNTESDRLYIVPKKAQDIIVNTSDLTPEQLALFINQLDLFGHRDS